MNEHRWALSQQFAKQPEVEMAAGLVEPLEQADIAPYRRPA
jgi:hypothetical protein